MNVTKLSKVIGLSLVGLTTIGIAHNSQPTMTAQTQSLAQRHLMRVICPLPSQLVQNQQTKHWSALHKWKSGSTSLATKMTTFLGAQWQGINLGQPFCIYRGIPKGTFNVALAYHTFSVTPQGGRWTSNTHHNLYRCIARDPRQCPFFTRLKPKAVSLIDQLQSLKQGQHGDNLTSQAF